MDPKHAALYQSNAENFKYNLTETIETLKENLSPLRHKPFLVMHDGYQYFEKTFDLNGYKDVIPAHNHDLGTSLKSLRDVLKNMSALKPSCVLAEKSGQTRFPGLVAKILKTRLVWVNPMGNDYVELLKTLGQKFVHCLKD